MPNLATKKQCTGCTACSAVCTKGCISMREDENGFVYPVIDTQNCIECGLCEKSCPILHEHLVPEKDPAAYAAVSMDEPTRLESSSGGIFSELARSVLEKGGVVFGAAYNAAFDVEHLCIEKEEDLGKLRGAKYAQSDLSNCFAEIKARLDAGQEVLFSGTPCQVGGLRAFLRKDYEKLLLVDFVCHSVPSPMVWRAFLKEISGRNQIASINLRSKANGWSRYRYSHKIEFSSGESLEIKNADSLYMKLFVNEYISRDSCADCRFKGYERVSDLTLGDFWGIWEIAPEMDDDKGTSVVLVHSEKGASAFAQLENKIRIKMLPLEDASRCNPAMITPAKHNENRDEVLKMIRENGISGAEKLFTERKPSIITRAKNLVKRIIK